MVRKTKGIVLRAVRYGETSLIVSVFTEDFGLQSYIINGVRTEKKGKEKASLFQPASQLELDIYHHEQRGINRIREASRSVLLHSLAEEVVKNNIALFMMELLSKSIKHPERNIPLFHFCESILQQLNDATTEQMTHLPFYFALHLPHFLGFGISPSDIRREDVLSGKHELFLDLTEGCFVTDCPPHSQYLSGPDALRAADLLSGQEFKEEASTLLPEKFLDFYALHISDFGKMRSYRLLQELLSE